MSTNLPRLLVVDDLFGRQVEGRRNEDRANLCGHFLLHDVTGDEAGSSQRIRSPVAEAVFARGQRPASAAIGDMVENDLDGTLSQVREGWEEVDPARRWALVLLDLCFYTGQVTSRSDAQAPGMPEGRPADDNPRTYFGLTILRELQRRWPELPVVILSSKEREEVSRDFATAGALGFVRRSAADGPQRLREHIWRHGLVRDDSSEIVGSSLPLLLALRAARRAVALSRHVLIRGERGSGKELLARYLHRQSEAAPGRPLIVVNAATLNPNLFASELFGHVRGAFTGAERDRNGCLVEADGGDLFLDEIGSLPVDIQPALLRALDSGEVTPVGGRAGRTVNVRVLAATNEDIEIRASRGEFRADLLDRVREGGTIELPPLRERLEDLPELTERFVREAERACGGMERQVDGEALARLRGHTWPGNVRELRSCLFEAVRNHSDIEHLTASHLPLVADSRLQERPAPTSVSVEGAIERLIASLSAFEFENLEPRELLGKLRPLEGACAEILARYLAAVLRTQVRPTPDEPDGKLFIQPALILAMGAPELATSKAYDLIIRLRRLSPDGDVWNSDPILHAAYERAMQSRRPASRRARSSGSTQTDTDRNA